MTELGERRHPSEAPIRRLARRVLVGRAMASGQMEETLLPKWMALPIFASDPISSVAYATEAALVVLVAVSLGARRDVLPISFAIAALLAIVGFSYRQTVRAYETSGGAYVVAKENLNTLASLVAGAALLTDYVLTVAVSVASGVVAITSAVTSLYSLRVELALACVAFLTVANLRGVRESGLLFAIPTYGFVAVLYATIATGVAKCAGGSCPQAVVHHPMPAGAAAIGLFVLLKAFASGSSALTGVEAIANGVNAFRRPQSRNAATTLLILIAICISLFVGVSYLAVKVHAIPAADGNPSVLSQIGRAAFPSGSSAGVLYYLLQGFTFAILFFAANTSFQGFPRLAALLARDRFFPRQFVNLGDRLVYSNGIVFLAGIAAALLVTFRADVNSLIHLYVVGVFTAFTISQAGMVRYWRRNRGSGWRFRAAVNGVGAFATGVVTLVVIETKFLEGAWIVIVAIPLFVLGFYAIHRRYRKVARRLVAGTDAVKAARDLTNTVVLPVSELDGATRLAVWYAHTVADNEYQPIWLPQRGRRDPRGFWWDATRGGPPLKQIDAGEGYVDSIREYVWRLPRGEADFVTVVLPEQFERRSLREAISRRTTILLKLRLLGEPGVVTTDIVNVGRGDPPAADRIACRVLASGAHAASLRAANYARLLGIEDTRAVFFAFDETDAARMAREWSDRGIRFPLEIDEAPYRDLGSPLLRYIRALTAEPGTIVQVVLPELVVPGWKKLLHNQRALYLKRLLLFEPGVIVTSVPYQLP